MISLAKTRPFYGVKFDGRSFDCGSKVGFLTANAAYALTRNDLAPEFHRVLQEVLQTTAPQQEPNPTGSLSQTTSSHTDTAEHAPRISTIG
jgi:hypothetical protein